MKADEVKQFVASLSGVIDEVRQALATIDSDDYGESAKEVEETERITSLCRSAIERATLPLSPLRKELGTVLADPKANDYSRARRVLGIAEALLWELNHGYVDSMEGIVHANLFGDYLEMAEHLLEEGYKDAAAVIIGSSLEAHLRQLCIKAGVDVQVALDGRTSQKRADRLNNDLKGIEVYGKPDHTAVASWLALRNKAAHGEYSEYVAQQIATMLMGVRDFMVRHPA